MQTGTLIGQGLVWFTLLATGAGMAAYLPGVRQGKGRVPWKLARGMVYLSALGLLATMGYLWFHILNHHFQFDYVYRYSSRDMPLRYVIASLWGGQEGTFLLWATYCGLLTVFLRFKAYQYEAPVNFFYMGITFFLLLMLVKASPFRMFDQVPPDGNGLNPLLQDPWMTIHPPIMFLGFASLGIPAAFAMAALVKEDWDEWVPRAIPFTLFGIMCLGTGLTLGGYWSYSILGWGGYWGWDPVENSSFVPWLLAITLLHNQVIQMRRGLFRRANLLLSLLPFILLTYSTFLTRSGVLADFSVHSFTDLGINQFLVAFMAVFLGGGVGLYIWKFRRIPVEQSAAPLASREYFMFLGALSFGLFGVFVCLGTSAPVLTRFPLLNGAPANVQPEFYNRIGLPFIILVCILVAIAPHLSWQRSTARAALKRIGVPLGIAVVAGILYALVGIDYWPYTLMMAAGTFALASNFLVAGTIIRRKWTAAGGYVAHVGVGFMVLGILVSTNYDQKQVIQLEKGHDTQLFGYTMKYIGYRPVEEGRKNAYDVIVTRGDKQFMMSPTMYYSDFTAGMMKKPAIHSFFSHDVYVAPGGLLTEQPEDRVMSRVVLAKKTPQMFMGIAFTFKDFETQSAHAGADPSTHQSSVTAHIDAQVGDAVHPLDLVLTTDSEGRMNAPSQRIPDTDYTVLLDGINASNGQIQLGVTPPPLRLTPGQTGEMNGYQIQFNQFDMDMGGARGNKITVYAEVNVTAGGENLFLKPGMVNRTNMDPEYQEAAIGNTGLNLVLAGVDGPNHIAEFYVTPEPREALWVEASLKPFIVLLWIGTALVVLGVLVAGVFRGRLAVRIARRTGNGTGAATEEKAA